MIPFGIFGINPLWIALIVISTVLGAITQGYVRSTYSKWSRVALRTGQSGAQVARQVLDVSGLTDVPIAQIAGDLTDNYDPRSRRLSLSSGVYSGVNVAAAGVAAHEAGHAIQHAQGYVWGSVRSALVPVANFGSMASWWFIIIGLVLGVASSLGSALVWAGVTFYAGAVLFQLVTLPVELNASKRALEALTVNGGMDSVALSGAKQVLTAAALTYVAAALIAALQLLYFIGLARRD